MGTSFLQGLKPVESTQFTSALKHRPPKETDLLKKKTFPQAARPVDVLRPGDIASVFGMSSFLRQPGVDSKEVFAIRAPTKIAELRD